ncbi:MAG: hypothetical protein JKY30_03580 [Flavobacteriales bacterium]|nr:hypothetical protein [Flavobacteriales bacterium]
MKKVLLFVGVVGMLVFTSCSKKTDCECIVNGVAVTSTADEAKNFGIDKDAFEALCDASPGCKMV